MVSRAVLSLGSNLGDRFGYLRQAVASLGSAVIAHSGVYETPPWGDLDQPAYLNAVVLVQADLDEYGWLGLAQDLERRAGRVRDPERRFGPRTLDVDVIVVWADDGTPASSDEAELTLPHPRAHLRAFVLGPLLDVAPDAELPGHGRVADLVQRDPILTDLGGLTPRPDLDLGGGGGAHGPGSGHNGGNGRADAT